MLDQMSWKEFQDWRNFNELEPFTAMREDMRTASIVAALYNLRRNTEKFPDPFPVTDFLLLFGDELERDRLRTALGHGKDAKPKQKSWQELKAMGQFLAMMYNALEEKPKRKKKEG
jgi:hypothetical protein